MTAPAPGRRRTGVRPRRAAWLPAVVGGFVVAGALAACTGGPGAAAAPRSSGSGTSVSPPPAPSSRPSGPGGSSAPKRKALPIYEPPVGTGRTLYLTFDDGPDRTWTPKVLEALAKYRAKATFFVLGKQIRVYPDLVAREARDGHSVQNHSNNHPDLTKLTDEQVAFKQLRPTNGLIRDHTGHLPTCLRPPYGAYDERVRALAGGLGLRLVLWSGDTLDWEKPGVDAIVRRAMANARPGAVLLFHDAGGERSQTVAALDIVLSRLSAQGYTFGTLCQT